MTRIDSHIHFGSIRRLKELEWHMEETGTDKAGLISLPDFKRGNFNPQLLYAKAVHPNRFYISGSLEYMKSSPPPEDQVSVLSQCGFDGLKLWEGKPLVQKRLGITLRDTFLRKALERASELAFPVLIHVADPVEFWLPHGAPKAWSYQGGKYPPFTDYIDQADEVAAAFPGLKIVFAHMLFLAQDLPRLADFLDRHLSVRIDLTPGRYFYPALSEKKNEAVSFFRKYKKRMLFGTDSLFFPLGYLGLPYEKRTAAGRKTDYLLRFLESGETLPNIYPPSKKTIPFVTGLGLEREVMDHLLFANHEELYGRNPRDLRIHETCAYLEDFMRRIAPSGIGGLHGELKGIRKRIASIR
ncbi:MAG: amidohydrolase family protein [Spirochaetales bacterium]|nr:amidohydrolase family protein [Spirochaetales bacterium]